MGKKMKGRAAPKEDMSDSESVEEGDIEALARASLRAGETVLGGEGAQAATTPESRGICNAPLLLQKLDDIEYKAPKDTKRVPWVDSLTIDGHRDVPKDIKAKDGVKLEGAFVDLATEAVKEAYRRFRVMKIPATRPTDFYAEMLRTDSQMFKVRSRASEEQRRMKIVEDRKAAQMNKKFSKNIRTKKLEDKAGEKRKTLDEIADWRKKNKDEKRNADDQDLDDILDKHTKDGGERKKKKGEAPSFKQQAKDQKWGHGGKKKYKKSNDSTSTNDMSNSPWGRKGDGGGKSKGKGKGGGKSKGKGKGGKRK